MSPVFNPTVRSVGRRKFFLGQIDNTSWGLLPSSLVLITSDGHVGHWCTGALVHWCHSLPLPGLGEGLALFSLSVARIRLWYLAFATALKCGVRCWTIVARGT